jgi:integrase
MTPLSKDNWWWRIMRPALKNVGLEWANFQVMRRTHSSLMKELKADPKLVADQLGHTVDVNLNVYTPVAGGQPPGDCESVGAVVGSRIVCV